MKGLNIGLSLIIVLVCMTSIAIAGDKAHWGYSGHEGPEHWGKFRHPDIGLQIGL